MRLKEREVNGWMKPVTTNRKLIQWTSGIEDEVGREMKGEHQVVKYCSDRKQLILDEFQGVKSGVFSLLLLIFLQFVLNSLRMADSEFEIIFQILQEKYMKPKVERNSFFILQKTRLNFLQLFCLFQRRIDNGSLTL